MRLIDADEIHNLVRNSKKYMWSSPISTDRKVTVSTDDIQFGVDKIPTVDAEPVRHGHWIEANDGTHYCSNCGHDAPFTWDDIDRNFMHSADEVPDFTANYCYCCGAKMDEVSEWVN